MALSKYEMYHGAVLTQVVRNPGFSLKLIERDNKKYSWGMYSIGAGSKDHYLFIKSSSKVNEGRKNYCNFTFSLADIQRIKKYVDKELLICLVCHNQQICLLSKLDILSLKILGSSKSCRVSVYWTKGSKLGVGSTYVKRLNYKIPRARLKKFGWGK